MIRPAAVLFAAVAMLGCESARNGSILDIEAEAAVRGVVFLDSNASADFEATDVPAANVTVALVLTGTADTVARIRTEADGTFSFPLVPVGRYDVVIPTAALGDSLDIVYRDPPGEAVADFAPDDTTSIALAAGDTATVRVGLAFPVLSIEAARELPAGRRIFVRGAALASSSAVVNGSLFVQGETQAIAATNVGANSIAIGDSVLVLGRTGLREGQPVLTNATAISLESAVDIDTLDVDAAGAASAVGGMHDANLVVVSDALITDTESVGQRFVMTIEDPSGQVDVSIPVTSALPTYVSGANLSVTGVLVPLSGGIQRWQIRPRSPADIEIRTP